MRFASLLIMGMRSRWRQMRYSLARELVVTACAGILAALLITIVNDLLSQQLAQISEELRRYASGVMLVGLSCLAGWNFAKQWLDIWTGAFDAWLRSAGEDPQTIGRFHVVRTCGLFLLWLGVIVALEYGVLKSRDFYFYSVAVAGSLLTAIVSQIVHRWRTRGVIRVWRFVFTTSSKPKMMVRWRLFQIFIRNRITRVVLVIVAVFVQFYVAVQDAPFPVLMLVAFVCGWSLAQALSFQAQDDMEFAWCEQQFGISHTEFVETYVRLASILGFSLGMILWGIYVFLHPMQVLVDHWALIESAKLVVAAYVAPFMMPFLLFQIDVRKPYIQAIASLMLGLIGMTAVYAHWAGVTLLPLFRYYAVTAQADRYYRA